MKYLVALIFGIAAGIGLSLTSPAVAPALGGVEFGSEYNALLITSAGTTCPKVGPGSIGSITIASTSISGLVVMDAASSTDAASTTIATFTNSPSLGTYVFDVNFNRGLCVRAATNFNGAYTTGWR